MRRLLLSGLLLLGLGALGAAQPPPEKGPEKPPEKLPEPTAVPPVVVPPAFPLGGGCASCAPALITRHISVPKAILIERQRAVAMPVLRLREVEVGRDVIQKMELSFNEQRQVITVLELKPRKVNQEVGVTEMKECQEIDPTCGNLIKVMKPVQVTKVVEITEFDKVEVSKEVLVRTPVIKTVPQEVIIRKLVVDEISVPAIEK